MWGSRKGREDQEMLGNRWTCRWCTHSLGRTCSPKNHQDPIILDWEAAIVKQRGYSVRSCSTYGKLEWAGRMRQRASTSRWTCFFLIWLDLAIGPSTKKVARPRSRWRICMHKYSKGSCEEYKISSCYRYSRSCKTWQLTGQGCRG
jgi:hypothetical protein